MKRHKLRIKDIFRQKDNKLIYRLNILKMENTSLNRINNSQTNEIIQFIKENKYYITGLLIVIGGASYYIYILKK